MAKTIKKTSDTHEMEHFMALNQIINYSTIPIMKIRQISPTLKYNQQESKLEPPSGGHPEKLERYSED